MNSLISFFGTLKDPYLLSLLVIPVTIYIWHIFKSKSKLNSIIFSNTKSITNQKTLKQRLIHVPFLLRLIASLFLIVAIARPQTTTKWEESTTEGIDIILALDISTSML